MFDREKQISEWRRELMRAGVRSPEVLDELEAHLREELERQMHAGRDEQIAFETAIRIIGGAKQLQSEFAKIGGVRLAFLWKLKRLLAGLLGWKSGISIPPMNLFTPDAKEMLELARREAPRLHHDYIGTEHVLLGLTISKAGIVPNLLRGMGVDSDTVRREIERWVGVGGNPPKALADIPFTPRAGKALTLAAAEARAFHSPSVGAEHILLGLLLEGGGVAMLVLRSLGVDIKKTREQIIKGLGTNGRGD
jgi:hypothetical protein